MGVETWTSRMRKFLVEGYLAGDRFDEMAERLDVSEAAARAQIRLLRKTQDIPLRKDIHRPASPLKRSDYRVTGPEGAPEVGWSIGGGSPATDAWAASLRADGLDVVRVE